MRFCSKQLKSFARRVSALWLLLLVLSGSVPSVIASPTQAFCPLTAKSAPVFSLNEDDPICDIRTYLKRNQLSKKPKTWWEKFWATDNFPEKQNADNSAEKRFSGKNFHRLCTNVCCANSSNFSNQNASQNIAAVAPDKIKFIAVAVKKIAPRFDFKFPHDIIFTRQSQPRAPPVFFS